jgi:hypothetical protein
MRTTLVTISLLLLGFIAPAQKGWFWINLNQSPKIPKIFSTDGQSGTGTRSHSLSNVPSGALLVITIQCEDDWSWDASISSTPSLTWTKRAEAPTASGSGNAEIWTAVYTAGGSITISSGLGSNKQSSTAWVITSQETTLGGASATVASQAAPSRSITSTRANSILICVTSDWNARNGSSRAYRDNATEAYYYFSSGATTGYHYYKLTTSTGSYTEGLTTPNNQAAGTCVLEIRGN